MSGKRYPEEFKIEAGNKKKISADLCTEHCGDIGSCWIGPGTP